jgi:broad specificity phosphatase PhoE
LGLTRPDHDFELTYQGNEDARSAGQAIQQWYEQNRNGYQVRQPGRIRVWTSPYTRTRQTAQMVYDHLRWSSSFQNLPVEEQIDLKEHINLVEQQFGLFDGIPSDDLPIAYPAEHAHYDKCEQHGGRFWARMPLGESRFDVAIRVHQAFGTFHRDHDRHGIKDIIVVAHGVTIRAFVMMWLHREWEWFEHEPNPGNGSVRLLEDGVDKGYIYEGRHH